jgi:hypothetical protein
LIGVFTDVPYPQIKGAFWSDNSVGNALWDMLQRLVVADVLEYRGEPTTCSDGGKQPLGPSSTPRPRRSVGSMRLVWTQSATAHL